MDHSRSKFASWFESDGDRLNRRVERKSQNISSRGRRWRCGETSRMSTRAIRAQRASRVPQSLDRTNKETQAKQESWIRWCSPMLARGIPLTSRPVRAKSSGKRYAVALLRMGSNRQLSGGLDIRRRENSKASQISKAGMQRFRSVAHYAHS